MASIPPPDVWYTLSLPAEIAEQRLLSALQLEAVIYACQQHERLLPNGRRAGFLIGMNLFYHAVLYYDSSNDALNHKR